MTAPEKEDAAALQKRFTAQYKITGSEILRKLERESCGCDYGGTSWTTREEAERVGRLLGLGPGKHLLDIGSGSGWPGLYLAQSSGCDATLSDLPFEGLRHAAERAGADQPAGACFFAAADGAALPFRDGWFDAISHSDVLCCLEAKQATLAECRRVTRPDGLMVFTVISVVPDLPPADHARAIICGPPFIDSDIDYTTMLGRAGWNIAERHELTSVFEQSVRRVLAGEEAHREELRALIGDDALADQFARRYRAIEGLERGLIRRDMFVAAPA